MSRLLAALILASLACAEVGCVTARFDHPRSYPVWTILGQQVFEHGCFRTRYWVAKSGKEGVGMMLRLTNICDEPHEVAFNEAAFLHTSRRWINDFSPEVRGQVEPRLTQTIKSRERLHFYMSFRFDNEEAWNDDQHYGMTYLELWTDDKSLHMPRSPRFSSRARRGPMPAGVISQRLFLHYRRVGAHRATVSNDEVSRSYLD